MPTNDYDDGRIIRTEVFECELCERDYKKRYMIKFAGWWICRGCNSMLINTAIHKKWRNEDWLNRSNIGRAR